MGEPDHRAARLESLKLLEGRRAGHDLAMWQAPTLTVLAQTFLLTILSDPTVNRRVALGIAIVGWAVLLMAGFALWQLRDRELHFSRRINVLAASLGMERPARPRPPRRWWPPREWQGWVLWCVLFAAFGVADLVALVCTHCRG
jgi:hypothetical protein